MKTAVNSFDPVRFRRFPNPPLSIRLLVGIDHGEVHRIVHNGSEWEAQYLYALPGRPQFSGILEDGRLFAYAV